MMKVMDLKNFDYKNHYKIDAQEFDYFEERTGATEHDERRVHEFIQSSLDTTCKTLLDIGCGNGWVAEYFCEKEINVISSDISSTNTKKVIEKVKSNFHTAVTTDSYFLPLKSNSIDCVIASEIIEHLTSPKDFITEMFRVIKPGGKVIITTPYREKLRYYLCIHCNQKTPVHAHINSFDENILSSLGDGLNCNISWKTFGNKLLIFARTYLLLRFLPFRLWKFLDLIANKFYYKPVHIIVEYKKLQSSQ